MTQGATFDNARASLPILCIMEHGWLLEAISLSLETSISTTTSNPPPPHHSPPPQGDSPRQRLIDGIVYSRKFILTYHICVLVSIGVFTVLHWGNVLVRWRRRKASKWQTLEDEVAGASPRHTGRAPWDKKEVLEDITEVSSSGSSANEASSSASQDDVASDERSALLHGARRRQAAPSSRSFVRALLMYQPRPMPLVNKTLSSNGTSLLIAAFLGLNILYCTYNMEFTIGNAFVLANRWGLMFVANLPLLYLFAAKNQPLNFLTGRSYESLNIFHRRLGELLCLQALLHALGMLLTWYTIIRPSGRLNFLHFLLEPVIYFGIGAFVAYEVLYITALASFRQRFYEFFLASHVVLQAAALAFVYYHHRIVGPYVGAALAIFLVDRIIFRLFVKSSVVTTSARILEDGETMRLVVDSASFATSRSFKSGWKPTDHVFITATTLGKTHALMAHPFTIASSAPTTSGEPSSLELLVRAQAGFSRDLLNYVHRHHTLSLRFDGPYGSSHARHLLEGSDLSILVAGGGGIAVAWPLVAHLTTDQDTESSIAIRRRKVVLIWVIHQDMHALWLPASSIQQARSYGVDVVIPRPTEEAGRPDLKSMIEEVVCKYDVKKERNSVGVVVSGPDGMNRGVRNTCAGLAWEGRDISVCVEKFGW